MKLLPDNPTQFDYLHAIRALAARSGDKQIFDLADAGMNPVKLPHEDDDHTDDEDPLWLANECIKGLLEGCGATEDHEAVLSFLRGTGLPANTVRRMHHALIFGDIKIHLPKTTP